VRANDQANVGFVDNIGEGTRTNGTAVLKIAFSDGSSGGFKTYYNVPAPAPGVDAGRTLFHVR
jgi:hypothetical protein